MFYYSLGAFVTLLSFILYKVTLSILNTKKNNQEATRRGCLPPPTLPSTNLLKTSILKESIKANKEDRGPQYIVNAMNSLSPDIHTVRVPVLNYELLVTRDPENLKAMLSTQSSDFDISNTRSAAFMPLLGQGIFTATGANWKHSRALVRPQFSHEEISNLELVDRHVNILLKRLEVDGDGWTEKLDMQPMFQNFALDTATEFLYGQSVNSQTVDKDPGSVGDGINGAVFGKYLDSAKLYVDKRGALAKLYWLLSWSKAAKEFQVHCQEIQKIADRLVKERLDYIRNNKELEKGVPGRKFVLLDELAKSTQNLLELRNETLHVLMAGRDPTGSLIGWVFYMLARNPTIFQKLRHTILEHFGSISGSEIDFKQLRNCQYLQYVINETIRFIAIIPMNERTALNDTTLPRGGGPDGTSPIFIPKGNQVLIPLYAMQHRPDLWGTDADVFNPERWEGRKIGWEFVPFGGGPRKCLGQQFAYNEASYLIVRFLQRFDAVENMEGPGPIRLHTAIENRSGTGVQVRFHKARSNFE